MEIQKTQPSIILPEIDVEDEKTKKILEEYNRIFFELITALYEDISDLMERVKDLED